MSELLQVVCPHCHTANRVPAIKLADGAKCGKCKQSLFNAHPVELNNASFQQHIGHSGIPVVVDFWAPWCGPCKMMAPIFEKAAAQLEPHAQLAKVNTEQEQDLAGQFGIRSIPTLAIFRQGRELARKAGVMDLGNLVAWVRSHI